MSNTLKVNMIETIRELAQKGWSNRRISKELGIHRTTVRKYSSGDSKCTISPTGPVGRKSHCSIHDEYIKELLGDGLSAQRIFQDLKSEKGFKGGYDSVKRYVRKLGNIPRTSTSPRRTFLYFLSSQAFSIFFTVSQCNPVNLATALMDISGRSPRTHCATHFV
jgi:predicted transcriptional regulator